MQFEAFPKIARLRREIVITEKLDGTNACIALFELNDEESRVKAVNDPFCLKILAGATSGDSPLALYAGSRKRWIAPEDTVLDDVTGQPRAGTDNFAFAQFVCNNVEELRKLGPGRHFGEWYGLGIQRGYGLTERRFALFNTARWGAHNPNTPACCEVVTRIPTDDTELAMDMLVVRGSLHVPGFMVPEGIVVYHSASRQLYKQTFENDNGKGA